jgi:nucleolar protein 15
MSDLEPSHSEEDEPEVSQEEDSPGEENVHLYGFSTDEDSSDDDLDVDEEAGLDVGSLPTVARDDATVKSRLEKAKRKPVRVSLSPPPLRAATKDSLWPLPTGIRNGCGLSEPDPARLLRRSNAGLLLPVRRDIASPPLAEQKGASAARALLLLPLIRCAEIELQSKTGRSKHYGFIEFVSAPVARIVAETMDNYLLMGHIMNCKIIPKDEVHPELWVGANRRWRVVPSYRLAQAQHNKVRPSASPSIL